MDGLPSTDIAGNVLRPETKAKISLRLPPTLNPETAAKALKELLEKDAPYGAHVAVEIEAFGSGWNAPETKPYLETIL